MWEPTHVKVTVKQAKNLLTKGKNGTNDAFVVIGIGKEKYQTSIKEKALPTVEWREECELAIPSQGNKANVQLTVYHHSTLGLEEFLGQISLPLSNFDVYEKPKYRSYPLKGKPEKDKKKGEKDRGELEMMINFTVKSGSFLDVSKKEKHKTSLTSLKHLGGSLMSIGQKEKQGLKNFAKSVSSKMDKIAKPRRRKSKTPSESGGTPGALTNDLVASSQYFGEADPGVISDDDEDDFRFDDEVKVNTRTSSPHSTMSRGSSLMHEQILDTDYDVGSYDEHGSEYAAGLAKTPVKPPRIVDETRESPLSQFPKEPSPRITSFSEPSPSPRTKLPRSIQEEESPREERFSSVLPPPNPDEGPSFLSVTSRSSTIDFHSPFEDTSFQSYREEVALDQTITDESHGTDEGTVPIEDQKIPSQIWDEPSSSPTPSSPSLSTSQLTSTTAGGRDSAISLGDDGPPSPTVSSALSSALFSAVGSVTSSNSPSSDPTPPPKQPDPTPSPPLSDPKKLAKSSSDMDVILRPSNQRGRAGRGMQRVLSSTDNWSPQGSTDVATLSDNSLRPRSGSLSEKTNLTTVPIVPLPTLVDEWERKLYGRSAMTASNENVSMSGSRSSLNTSRESSIHDVRREDAAGRSFPEVKALTLEKKVVAETEEDGKKQKRKIKTGFKQRFFKTAGSRERMPEDSHNRFVEGGNDRLPSIPSTPTRNSKLPQEVHDMFAGKSREDLMEEILKLRSRLDKQARHSAELEEYIDNLLLRVMEATPHLLQAPVTIGQGKDIGIIGM